MRKSETGLKTQFFSEHHIDQRILENQINSNSSLQNQDGLVFYNHIAKINSSEKDESQNEPLNININYSEDDFLKVSGLNETSNGKHCKLYESDII